MELNFIEIIKTQYYKSFLTDLSKNFRHTDYSTPSDNDFMRCFFSSTLNSARTSTNNAERTAESPNRIAQLIATRREKLMRLAALENGSSSNQSKSTLTTSPSSSSTTVTSSTSTSTNGSMSTSQTVPNSSAELETSNCETPSTSMSKSRNYLNLNSRSKIIKRRHNKIVRRTRSRRKLNNTQNSSSSEDEINSDTEKIVLQSDGTQPSTSTGVTSIRRLRYNPTPDPVDSHQSYSSNCSNSDEDPDLFNSSINNGINGKSIRTTSKSDSDDSPSPELLSQKRKSSRKIIVRRFKSKRMKLECNGVEQQNGVTPTKNSSKQLTISSDSGITSGVSTAEKNKGSESPYHKKLEDYKKRVDNIRRNYRKRVMTPRTSSSESDDA